MFSDVPGRDSRGKKILIDRREVQHTTHNACVSSGHEEVISSLSQTLSLSDSHVLLAHIFGNMKDFKAT